MMYFISDLYIYIKVKLFVFEEKLLVYLFCLQNKWEKREKS